MTSTRYLCVHCGHRFALGEEDEARCPSCMRKGGLEKVAAPEPRPRARRTGLVLAIVATLAVLGGGYAFWSLRAPASVEGEPPLAPLSVSELRGYLRNESVSDGGFADVFEAGDAIERVASHASGEGAVAKARALASYVKARRDAHAFETWPISLPREEALREPAETAAVLEGEDRAHLYPLEVALLATAALRSADVPAMLAEVWRYGDERAPLDPSGQRGYFAVAVYADEPGQGEPTLVDVYGGARGDTTEGADFRVLTDVQAVAAALVSRALHELQFEADGAGALRTIEGALKLDPRAPYARTTRAAVLLAAQAVDEAGREVESAFQIRSDAPRRVAMAAMHYMNRDLDRASSELNEAIDAYPDYALAYLRLAAVQMDQGSMALAQQSLETAERLDAGTPELPLLWAQYYVVTGDAPMARLRARAAAESFGALWQTQLMAAQIFRAVDDEQGMRRAVQAALAHVPEAQKAQLRQQIEASMGASALEPPEETEPEPSAPEAAVGDLQLRLGDDPAPAAPGATLGAEASPDGPVLMMGDPSDYHLLGPDQRLELRLGGSQ